MTFTWFFSTESYVTRHAGSRHCSPLVNPQKLNIMSIKFWFVIASGMTVLSQESMAQATCPGTVGASSTPDSDFMVNANGTVVHNTTELMWKRCNEGLTGLALRYRDGDVYHVVCCINHGQNQFLRRLRRLAGAEQAGAGIAGRRHLRFPRDKRDDLSRHQAR